MTQRPSNKGINLTQLKKRFIRLNKRGLYVTLFHYYSVIVFVFLCWIYLSSDFNLIPEVYGMQANQSQLYQSHFIFRILFWIGLFLFLLVELAAFWQKKLKITNSIPMMVLICGYLFSGAFIFVSRPLYSFLRLYFINTDPFKSFDTPYQVLSNLNYELYGLFLIISIALFGFSFLLLFLRKLNVQLQVVRHN